jgi:glycosyltransferase involved in cell wall biosynthesis
MKISVSMIVKNESSCLSKCLDSLKGVDEIVIIDTGSEDDTVDIAKQYTDKVYYSEEYKWRDNFAFSRNQSLDLCTGDWILIIDADEKLEDGAVDKIRKFINENPKVNSIKIQAWANNLGSFHYALRLFKRIPEIRWHGEIHNYLSVNGEIEAPIKWLVSYSDAHLKDPDRALRILTKVVKEKPTCVREKFYLAREYWYRKNWKLAIYYYKWYLETAYFAAEIADAYMMLALCYKNLGNMNEARTNCLAAININTNFKEALLFMASVTGPGNSKKWKEWANTATNEGILFVRRP